MDKPFAAYSGSEPFVFVCYAHTDAVAVYADLVELDGNGVHVWYDEGIPAGSAWRGEIAAAIKGAGRFIFYISKASLASSHCLREVDYALHHDIEIIPVYLEDCPLPEELELVLNRVQALFRNKDDRFMEHLLGALQGKRGLTALRPKAKKRRWGLAMALLVLAVVLVPVAWQQWQRSPNPEAPGAPANAGPSAYDRYLDGQKLMARWDKGDNLEKATGLFREATTIDPGFALAYARLAEALRFRYALTGDKSKLDEAADNAKKATELNPDLAPVQVALSRVYAAQGDMDLAYAAAQRAVSIDPNNAEANHALASMYVNLGRLDDAEASFKKALALDPDNLVILDGYANFLFSQSRFEEAAEEWQAVVRLAPDHFAALVNLGSALSNSGQEAEAITMFERAIQIQPTYMGYVNLGTAYSKAHQYPKAVGAYEEALKIDDSDWLAWGNLAYVYSWMNGMEAKASKTFEHAIQLAEAAREQNPRDPWAYSDLGLYYAKTGKPELSRQRVETAITLAPESGEIFAAAAEAYEQLGQRDKAIELARKSLELGFPPGQLQRNQELSDLLQDPRMQVSPKPGSQSAN